MNVQLSPTQLAEISNIQTMSRREKLFRLARLIRECALHRLYMFSNIEYLTPNELVGLRHPQSAFAVAAQDGILKDAGLKGDTVKDAQEFFALSNNELHAFSCDCGGVLSNEQMARRVESLAIR